MTGRVRALVAGAATAAAWSRIAAFATVAAMQWRPLGFSEYLASVLGGLGLGALLAAVAIVAASVPF